MPEVDPDYTKGLARNLAIGLVLAYVASSALCFIAVGELSTSLAAAALPAVFAGPYVGILITLVSAIARQGVSERELLADGINSPGDLPIRAVALPNATA